MYQWRNAAKIYIYIYIYKEKLQKENNPKFVMKDNYYFIMIDNAEHFGVITFFRFLNSWKMLLK